MNPSPPKTVTSFITDPLTQISKHVATAVFLEMIALTFLIVATLPIYIVIVATLPIYLNRKMTSSKEKKNKEKGFSKQSILESHGKVTCEAKTIGRPSESDLKQKTIGHPSDSDLTKPLNCMRIVLES